MPCFRVDRCSSRDVLENRTVRRLLQVPVPSDASRALYARTLDRIADNIEAFCATSIDRGLSRAPATPADEIEPAHDHAHKTTIGNR